MSLKYEPASEPLQVAVYAVGVAYAVYAGGERYHTPEMMAVRHFEKIALVVESRVRQGDFDFLAHVLNAVGDVAPERRPVLVLRDVINLDTHVDRAHFARFYRMCEHAKQETSGGDAAPTGEFRFPVFVETSDLDFLNSPSRVSSPRSFQTYRLGELDDQDIRTRLAEIWSTDQLSTVIETVGGHGGSLEAVFYQWSIRGGSKDGGGSLLREAIAAVREGAYSQVQSAVVNRVVASSGASKGPAISVDTSRQEEEEARRHVGDQERICFLAKLRAADYEMRVLALSEANARLSRENIVFFHGADLVGPQHRMLKTAIGDFLSRNDKAIAAAC